MSRPNILFLLSDEHSHRFMGHISREMGGEDVETPTFDALASGGAVFTDAYCQMPLCTPSRLSLLSGREVCGAGAWSNNSVMRPGVPTLPGVLAEAGYETCLVGKMHLGGSRQYVGFQHRPYGDLTGKTGHQADPIDDPNARTIRGRTTTAVGVTEIPESLLQEQVVAQEAVAWLREHEAANPDKPWFLMASFSRPHFPLTAPRRWIDRYSPQEIEPRAPAGGDSHDHPMSVGMRKGFRADEIDHDEMMRARAAYFACVSYLDELLGDLLARLEATGQLDNTIIVYTSDHGEMAGEHAMWWKNGWYEACTRVPLIVSTPGQRADDGAARRVSTPVALVDLFPTLCAFAGADAPDGLDGRDLSGAVGGHAEAPDRPVFCDALTPRWGAGTEFRAARWRQFKYVQFRDAPELLFDLASDPLEQRDLIARGATGDAAEALAHLREVVNDTMDFDAAEESRRRDDELSKTYALHAPGSGGNLYHMPRGHIVNAEAALYAPTTIAESPDDLFTDFRRGDEPAGDV